MTTYYVDDTATGAKDGTSWTDAYDNIQDSSTGLLDIRTLIAGDEIRIRNTHDESYGAVSTTLDWTTDTDARENPVRVISCNTSNLYVAGAKLYTTGSFSFYLAGEGVQFDGMDLAGGANLYFGGSAAHEFKRLIDCQLTCGTARIGGSQLNCYTEMINCDLTMTSSAATPLQVGGNSTTIIRGGSITATAVDSGDKLITGGERTRVVIEDCDLSNMQAGGMTSAAATYWGLEVFVRRCSLHANTDKTDEIVQPDDHGAQIVYEGCYTSTDTVPAAWQLTRKIHAGFLNATDAEVRTGGATDGETTYSWKLSPGITVNTGVPLETPPMIFYVAAGSQTVTLYLASATALDTDEFWIEVSSPDESIPADAQGYWQSTQADPLVTGSAITTDSVSTWTSMTAKQKVSVDINPTEAGVVVVRAFLAKDQDIYIDPAPMVS